MSNQITGDIVNVWSANIPCIGGTVSSALANSIPNSKDAVRGFAVNPEDNKVGNISIIIPAWSQSLDGTGIIVQRVNEYNSLQLVYKITKITKVHTSSKHPVGSIKLEGKIDGVATILLNSESVSGIPIKNGNADGYFPVDKDHDISVSSGSLGATAGTYMIEAPAVSSTNVVKYEQQLSTASTKMSRKLDITEDELLETTNDIVTSVQELYKKYPIIKDPNSYKLAWEDLPEELKQKYPKSINDLDDKKVYKKIWDEFYSMGTEETKKFMYSDVGNIKITKYDYTQLLMKEIDARSKEEIIEDNNSMDFKSNVQQLDIKKKSRSLRAVGGVISGALSSMIGAMSSASGYNRVGGTVIGCTSLDLESVGASAQSAGVSAYGQYNWTNTDVVINIFGSSAKLSARDFKGIQYLYDDLTGFITGVVIGGTTLSIPTYFVSKPSSPWFEYFSTNYNKVNPSGLSTLFMAVLELLPAILAIAGSVWAPAKVGSLIAQGVVDTIPPEMKSYVMFSMWMKIFGTDLPYFQDLKLAGWSWSGGTATLDSAYNIITYTGIDTSIMKLQNGVTPPSASNVNILSLLRTSQGGNLVQAYGIDINLDKRIPFYAVEDFVNTIENGVRVI